MSEAIILPQFVPDLSKYALSNHSHSGYATKTHSHSQYLTSHQSLAGYATQTWVSNNFAPKGSTGGGNTGSGSSDPYASQAIGDGWYYPPAPQYMSGRNGITAKWGNPATEYTHTWKNSKWVTGTGDRYWINPGDSYVSSIYWDADSTTCPIIKWKWG